MDVRHTAMRGVLVMAMALAAPSRAHAQERVPPKLALLVMLKVLTYDRNLAARGDGDFVVLVAYERGQDAARREVEAAILEIDGAAMHARPVRFVYAEFDGAAALGRAVADHGARAILLLGGLSPEGVRAASAVATERQVYTLALDPSLVERALALGVMNKDGRPQIVLNLAAARSVNAAFEPAVLKLAKIYE